MPLLVPFQGDIVVFSEFVRVHGKACLAGKTHSIRCAHGAGPGCSLSKRHNAVHGRGQAPLMSRDCVAALTNGTTRAGPASEASALGLACEARLASPDKLTELATIMLQEH
jgi:hypothetical protein